MNQLRDAIRRSDYEPIKLLVDSDFFSIIEKNIKSFDNSTLEQKKRRIETIKHQIEELKKKALVKDLAGFNKSIQETNYINSCFHKLALPVKQVKGIGEKTAQALSKKGIVTVEDLLYFIPRIYEDRRFVIDIANTQIGRRDTVEGTVIQKGMKNYGRRLVYEVTISDRSGNLVGKWFHGNREYLKKTFKLGKCVVMTGEISGSLFAKEMIHPDFEILDEANSGKESIHFKRIVPVYSETEGLHQKKIRKIIMETIGSYSKYILSPVPQYLEKIRKFPSIQEAVRSVHFPNDNENITNLNDMRSRMQIRLIYDELFTFFLLMAMRKKSVSNEKGISFKSTSRILEKFLNVLPFKLTKAQMRVISEIEEDMKNSKPMNRLLQGDVGSGKTVVAIAAMTIAAENGYQAAMMAPTEILTVQHYIRIKELTNILGLHTAMLTSNVKYSERREIIKKISNGEINIIVGTHALIQEDIDFNNLGIAVIDEQHRFGVIQRAALRNKGVNPDVLVMTATPIPRTLAMTVYGDLDVSIIDEMPPGRKIISTKLYSEKERKIVYEIVRKELIKGNQIFIVYPLVDESEKIDLKNATQMAEHLQQDVFPEYVIGLIHGRMKSSEKDSIMSEFVSGKIKILVSTTVIEVGIDVPQASVIIIEHADRFGLSQLHQLRGRIGRGNLTSYCIMMANDNLSEDSRKRLKIMESTNDGFKIAEEDLAIRGPGDFMGTRQSGLPDFKIANIIRDAKILTLARKDAFDLVEKDPNLENTAHILLKEIFMKKGEGRIEIVKTA